MAKKKERKIPELLIWTDINNWADDLAAMVVLSYLADHKVIDIKGVLSQLGTYETKRRRAMFAKGALSFLGYPYVRAVPGGDYLNQEAESDNHYIENSFTPLFEKEGTVILRSGGIFLQNYIKSVKDKNIVLLLNAPFSDLAKYIKATGLTIAKKVKKIVIMGGVITSNDEENNIFPDLESFNFKNSGDEAAAFLFDYIKVNQMKAIVVPPQTIKDMAPDFSFLDSVTNSKNPVAQNLCALKDEKNPTSMIYDMISSLCLSEGAFKANGGVLEQQGKSNIFVAKIEDAGLMKAKLKEIFDEKLMPKKISLSQLFRKKEEEANA